MISAEDVMVFFVIACCICKMYKIDCKMKKCFVKIIDYRMVERYNENIRAYIRGYFYGNEGYKT